MSEKSPYKKRKMENPVVKYDCNYIEGYITSPDVQSSKQLIKNANYRVLLARKGFVVHETLGSGSYSKVKHAINMINNAEHVAIKIIDRQKAPQDYLIRFLPRELEVWPLLKHPNILLLQEAFQDDRRVFMVTDYVPGGDVLKYIQEKGAVSDTKARKWLWQICDAVRYMHGFNFAHRDLKLENLLLDTDLNIKVADFGFIRRDAGVTLSTTFCGSKSYAAPEILIGRAYNPRKSDVWAIGVILYIVITGKMPFDESKGTRNILKEQETLELHWPRNIRFSEVLQRLVATMFTWAYEKRPDIYTVMKDPWFRKHPDYVNYHRMVTRDSAVSSHDLLATGSVATGAISSANQVKILNIM